MSLLSVVASAAGTGPMLLGAAVRAPWHMTAAVVSGAPRVARAAAEATLGPPAAVMRQATHSLDRPPAHLLWSDPDRAHLTVRGLAGAAAPVVAAGVEEALGALDGVSSARVDAVTGEAVVRFDPARLTTDDLAAAVARGEAAADIEAPDVEGRDVDAAAVAGATRPVAVETWALAADLAGLSAAVAGRLLRLPPLPSIVAAVPTFADNQPRVRRLLEQRLGPEVTDLVLAVANAAAQAGTQGTASLVVDSAQRLQAVAAQRARRAAFGRREGELWADDRPARAVPVEHGRRPLPVPPGPVERYADRAAGGSLLAAGALLAGTRRVDLAAKAVLIGAPKAARGGREAFTDTLVRDLSRRGAVVGAPAALRRLDRLDTVVIDAPVLHGERRLVVTARSLADHWTLEHVWSASQRLLEDEQQLPLPPPRGRQRHRLDLLPTGDAPADGLTRLILVEDDVRVGEVEVGTELDPYADAVLDAAAAAGLRLLVTEDPAAPELASRAAHVLDRATPLRVHVRRLQSEGAVLALVSRNEDALAVADVGLGIVPVRGRVPWAAHVLLGPGLLDVPRLLSAVPRAKAASSRGVTSAAAATFLGALLTAVGGPGRSARAVLPVTAATAGALVWGTLSARAVDRQPPPAPVLHTPWHALEPDEVLARLTPPASSDDAGTGERDLGGGWAPGALAGVAALARNVVAELADPLTPVLATGAAASAVVGSPTDALLLGTVLGANAVISGAQRLRAERALNALLQDQRLTARVVPRPADHGSQPAGGSDGSSRSDAVEVPAAGLRLGEVVELAPGDVVPADARLLTVEGLELDEASLTGESVAVEKQVQATPAAELPDRVCMVYEGTTVLAGRGTAVVVAVGRATEAGRALSLASGAAAPAGMQARLEELTRRGLPVTLLGGAAVTLLALLRGRPLAQAIGSGVGVAVAAVPEGLPLVATVAQLGAARRLSARGVLVRSARTVEALGRVDTVCFDKTGTLTEGRLRLVRLAGIGDQWAPDAQEGRRVLRAAALASPRPEDGRPVAHATDQAILDGAQQVLGERVDPEWVELSELPFQSDRGFSAALGRRGEGLRLVVKGAPEVLLPRCTHQRVDGNKRRLDQADRQRAVQTVHALASQGLRVLAVARRNVSDVLAEGAATPAVDPEELTEDLTLLGFVALADIPRPGAAATVATLRGAGLSPVMITGDHPLTAAAIAADLGIPAEHVVTGREFAGLSEADRADLVTRAHVFARVSPEQKLRIIAALRGAGRVVAMTGDGANDAAAIRLADVGIGMAAHGSTPARSAADLVLTRPDVGLLVDALVEGRAMWGRVRDAVAILLGGNAGEVGFTLAGTALAGRAPIGTRQFLLVNMLTDLLPSMAIALAPTPAGQGDRYRLLVRGVPSLGAPLLRDIAVRGVATGTGALVAWQVGRFTGTRRRASTMALAALVGTQLGQTLLIGGRNPLVLATGIGSTAALAAVIQTPGLSQFFGCTPLDPLAWATVVGCAAGTTVLAVFANRLLPGQEPRSAGQPEPLALPRPQPALPAGGR